MMENYITYKTISYKYKRGYLKFQDFITCIGGLGALYSFFRFVYHLKK